MNNASKTLGPTPLAAVLAPSIKDDPTIQAAAAAVDAALLPLVQAIPRMLLWARLWSGVGGDAGQLSPALRRIVDWCALESGSSGLPPLSDGELELLAWQMHVDFWNPAWPRPVRENLVRQATAWHRLKGTPAGVRLALALFDVQATVDESGRGEKWAIYELELAKAPGELLPTVVEVATETAPQRCRLRRVYGGYDRRPIVLDVGPPLDLGFLDDDSGVWDPVTGVKQSFGNTRALQAQPAWVAHLWSGQGRAVRAFYVDKPILDQWRLDTPTVKSHGMVGGWLVSLASRGISGHKHRWTGPWDHRQWNDCDGPPAFRPMPRRRIDTHRSVSRSQLVLDCGRLDASLERLDRQRAVVIDHPPRLDGSRLDCGQQALGLRQILIDARFHHSAGGVAQATRAPSGLGLRHIRGGLAQRAETHAGIGVTDSRTDTLGLLALRRPCSLPDGTEWAGPWDHRPWRTMRAAGVFTHSTTAEE
ncbi:phage tail protein [Megalodesulfovibrio paquesii]